MTPQLHNLIELLSHRWNIPILAQLQRESGAKFVTLSRRLGLSRSALSAALKHLTGLGLVQRNPGYGHPLRPEYLLAPRAQALAADCAGLVAMLQQGEEQQLAFRKWSLPLLTVCDEQASRFSQLRASLGQPSPRATTLALKGLQQQRWLQRQIAPSYPPSVNYLLDRRGQQVRSALRPLYLSLPTELIRPLS